MFFGDEYVWIRRGSFVHAWHLTIGYSHVTIALHSRQVELNLAKLDNPWTRIRQNGQPGKGRIKRNTWIIGCGTMIRINTQFSDGAYHPY